MSRKTRGQPKVLVVDDEPDLLELLEMTLSRMGLDTSRAESVAEAQRMLDREPFDLCLTDWNLPDGEGLRVVEHITQKALDVPVAVITAFGSPENAVAALKAGAFDYLAKPGGARAASRRGQAGAQGSRKTTAADQLSVAR
jgi:two-component system response regulator PilR (NtrC family)